MIDKQLLQKRFSQRAESYDDFAIVQKKMAIELIHTIPPFDENRKIRILEIGCGTGYLTNLLCETFPLASIMAVDLAPGMIEKAKQRITNNQVTFRCGDIEEMVLNESYDIIISNATLQWINDLPKLLKKLGNQLAMGGVLAFSTFGNHTFHELHTSFENAKKSLAYERANPPGQSFYTLQELSYLCKQELGYLGGGDNPFFSSEKVYVEYFETVRMFFSSVKKVGANNSNVEGYCQRPSFFKELMRQYDGHFRDMNGVKATYHSLFIRYIR
ncbi:malonyl-ACP O-methyltransferase BioC [Bacillus spongiae]|uniref:Malonyl-[acyl-carrier protein] O-methyltransferase n=1 Tax=Bacillus spongiae TaxID=2683610 RepID=A0ABU8HDR2_9BACI